MRGAGRRQRLGAERAAAVGVAHVFQAFAIGGLQRRRIGDVSCRIRFAARGLQTLLKQTQRTRQRRSGGEFGCRQNLAAAIGDIKRFAQVGAERREVFDRQRAAGGLNVGGEAFCQIAFVEIARPGAGQMRHRGLEPVLRHADVGLDAPGRVRRQAVDEIGGSTGGIAPQIRGRACNHQRGPPVDAKAFARECDARRQQFLPRQSGVAAMRFLHAGDHAGYRNRSGAVQVAVVFHPRPREQVGGSAVAGQRIILETQAAWRAHAVIDYFIAVFARAVEHHRAAAAEPAHPGLQHAERKGGRDHGIDAIAAGGQHLGADLRCLAGLRGDDAAFGSHRGFADLLGGGELVAHGFAFDISDGGVDR